MRVAKRIKAPKWFTRSLKAPSEDRFLEVRGCRIHYLRWGQPGKPGLLLVHGGFAHAHWFDFIAPFFADDYCVAAMDLSGMGDSGHRRKYSAELFAQEAVGVCSDAGFAAPSFVVGHSFGGFVALKTGLIHGKKLAGIVLVDSPIRPPELQQEHDSRRLPGKRKEIYPNLEAARKRFRLIPAQPCNNQFILDHIARHSLAKLNGGWNWKFDPKVFDGLKLGNVSADFAKVECPMAVVYGAKSALFPPEVVAYMTKLLDPANPFIEIPKTHHHLFLERPLIFIDVLRRLLDEWDSPDKPATGRNARHRLLGC